LDRCQIDSRSRSRITHWQLCSNAAQSTDRMNKKNDRPTASRATPRTGASVRQQLKRFDREIVRLCHERARLLQQAESPDQFLEALQTDPLEQTRASSTGPLTAEHLQAVFRELNSATRSLIKVDRVAYLGPEFSYSHLAAVERFGQSLELLPVSTIGGVFESVERGDSRFGVVPIENSTDGRIVDTLDRFVGSPVRICGEVSLPIHHHLLARGPLSQIREVHSKPQALSQCRNWLARHLPTVRQVAAASTTAAAQAAAADPQIAAIASQQAGINYALTAIGTNIEDNPDNVTRFTIIGMEPARRTGNDKTSLMFELTHQPGALADAMSVFKRHRLNLTWIESFPKKGSQNEYLFFVELEGHASDPPVRRAVQALERKTVRVVILGCYPRGHLPARSGREG
jgi:chorismate mutase/prephenate dehydratase